MEDQAAVCPKEGREENFPRRIQTSVQAGRSTWIPNGAPACCHIWGWVVCSGVGCLQVHIFIYVDCGCKIFWFTVFLVSSVYVSLCNLCACIATLWTPLHTGAGVCAIQRSQPRVLAEGGVWWHPQAPGEAEEQGGHSERPSRGANTAAPTPVRGEGTTSGHCAKVGGVTIHRQPNYSWECWEFLKCCDGFEWCLRINRLFLIIIYNCKSFICRPFFRMERGRAWGAFTW